MKLFLFEEGMGVCFQIIDSQMGFQTIFSHPLYRTRAE